MRRKLLESSGQTLVVVALLMVVFLALLALAVDVGHIYQVRRAMQNAADAGALAAARARCFGGTNGSPGSVSQAIAAGNDYAINRNHAQAATTTPSQDGWTFTVTATTVTDLFFAGIVGRPQTPVGAVAAAKCGAATSACGLWPVAFNVDQWDDIYNNGAGCGQDLAIWSDKSEDCEKPDPTGNRPCCDRTNPNDPDCYPIDCEKYDCDLSNPKDGIDDVFTDSGRAWIDFSGYEDPEVPPGDCPANGCGSDELGDCIAGSPNVKITLPACVSGDSGVKGGVKQDVESRAGDVIGVPLYDPYAPPCEGPETCRENDYLVTDFGCIKLANNNVWRRLSLKLKSGPGKPWNGWVIMARMYCEGCATNCGGTGDPGPTPGPGDVRAVSLIR